MIGCQAKPVSDALPGRETLNLNGSMGRKVRNGKYRVLDIPEGGARAGGADAKEGAILRSEKDTVQNVAVGVEPQHKAIGDKDRQGWSDWDGWEGPEDRRRVGGAGIPFGERVHVGGSEHEGISCVVRDERGWDETETEEGEFIEEGCCLNTPIAARRHHDRGTGE